MKNIELYSYEIELKKFTNLEEIYLGETEFSCDRCGKDALVRFSDGFEDDYLCKEDLATEKFPTKDPLIQAILDNDTETIQKLAQAHKESWSIK